MLNRKKKKREKLKEQLDQIWESLSDEKKEIALELLKRLKDKEWDD